MAENEKVIKVRLHGILRQVAGGREIVLRGRFASLEEILKELANRVGPAMEELLFDKQGKRWDSLILLINEEPADMEANISTEDVISILTPLAGGFDPSRRGKCICVCS